MTVAGGGTVPVSVTAGADAGTVTPATPTAASVSCGCIGGATPRCCACAGKACWNITGAVPGCDTAGGRAMWLCCIVVSVRALGWLLTRRSSRRAQRTTAVLRLYCRVPDLGPGKDCTRWVVSR